jgi:divalent metal cation (Fe/Co/Zn/Cd) transporter
VDSVVSLAIAAFIAVLGVRILVGSFHTLTDRAVLPPEEIVPVVSRVPGVVRCVDVRSRGGAEAVYLDLIVHVDGSVPLRLAHDVADRVERALADAFPQIVDVVVHVEPAEGT